MVDLYISPGNRRMDFPTFSLPAVKACPNATDNCKKFCYALKAERTWKSPRESRIRNLKGTKDVNFIPSMISKIRKLKGEFVRIHESGDFYNQEYLDKWIVICNKNPKKKFLVYTQMYNLDWSNKPDNMIVYWTVWPDTDMNEVPKGLRAFVVDDGSHKIPEYPMKITTGTYKIKKCAKGKGSKLKCNDCMWCYKGKGNVIFKLH